MGPEGVHSPPGPASAWWCDRTLPAYPGPEVQLRQDDLQEVLCPPPPQGNQLPQEGLRPHLQPQTQEEAEVNHGTYAAKFDKKTTFLPEIFLLRNLLITAKSFVEFLGFKNRDIL